PGSGPDGGWELMGVGTAAVDRELVLVAVRVGRERAHHREDGLAVLHRLELSHHERASLPERGHAVRQLLAGEHRAQEVPVQRVDARALGRGARDRVHGLGNHEPSEQAPAEPVRGAPPPAVAVRPNRDELDRLLHDRLDVDLWFGHEPDRTTGKRDRTARFGAGACSDPSTHTSSGREAGWLSSWFATSTTPSDVRRLTRTWARPSSTT